IRAMDAFRLKYQDTQSKLADDEARQTAVENEIRELESKGPLDKLVVPEKTPAEIRLDDLQLKLKEMQTRYLPQYPEVKKLQEEIRDVQEIVASQPPKPRLDPSPAYLRYVELKSELHGITQRINSYKQELTSTRRDIAGYSQRVESAPTHE